MSRFFGMSLAFVKKRRLWYVALGLHQPLHPLSEEVNVMGKRAMIFVRCGAWCVSKILLGAAYVIAHTPLVGVDV
jgi:hypothetical protein